MTNELIYECIKSVNGQFGYVKLGNGPNLVMVVGYSGTLFHWNRSFIYKLAESFTVYLLDNRHIGKTISDNPPTIPGMAQDVRDFIDVLQIDKPFILGWSMGGIIVQELLKANFIDYSGAVLLASTSDNSLVSKEFLDLIANQEHMPPHQFKSRLYATFFSENDSDKIKLTIKDGAILIKDYHYRFNFVAKEFQDTAVSQWQGSLATSLQKVEIPVLIIRARNDLVIDKRAGDFFAESFPYAKLITYPSGGHFFVHKAPVQLALDIVNFFINQSL